MGADGLTRQAGRHPRRRHARWQSEPRVLLAVAFGGMIGASMRVALGNVMPSYSDGFPWDTLIENAGGSLLLGIVLVVTTVRLRPTSLVRPFLAVGLLGAFTTFSAFIIEIELLVRDGDTVTAAFYLAATLIAGLGAALLGIAGTMRVVRRGDLDSAAR